MEDKDKKIQKILFSEIWTLKSTQHMIIKKAIMAYLKGIDQFQGQQYLTLISDSQKEAILLPKCHLAMSIDIFVSHNLTELFS